MALDQFLKLSNIKGESQDDKHKDEVDVLAWSWGSTQQGTTHAGGGGGAGKVAVQDMSITKWVDLASPTLFQLVASGKHIDEGVITVRKAGDKPLEYLVITMKEILVTSVQTGGSGGEDRLTENVSLNFAEVHVKYTVQNKDGSAGASPEIKFHIAQNKFL
jgi:type VI secretion system secreted protein Hcp